MSTEYTCLRTSRSGHIVTVTLARPQVHNAFNPTLITELYRCFEALAIEPDVRAVVLTGEGPSFCAGADLSWMRESLHYTREANITDTERLALMFDAINGLPKPLVGRVNGAAMGGGVGLMACCDIVIAVEGARFSFSEVKLGLIPAVIAQYVVPKIGVSQARALFTSGERFDAQRAREIGLVHRVVQPEALDSAVSQVLDDLLAAGPGAIAAAKNLVRAISNLGPTEARTYAIEAIAMLRTGPEGQEGISAFLEKRPPAWRK